mmetsp:Transcript_2081/g.2311  ORF Transcript_2081/g.2311 Transcript_2081/m.2311 type:complete len:237 (-) Transcript_2081:488-1198(-)
MPSSFFGVMMGWHDLFFHVLLEQGLRHLLGTAPPFERFRTWSASSFAPHPNAHFCPRAILSLGTIFLKRSAYTWISFPKSMSFTRPMSLPSSSFPNRRSMLESYKSAVRCRLRSSAIRFTSSNSSCAPLDALRALFPISIDRRSPIWTLTVHLSFIDLTFSRLTESFLLLSMSMCLTSNPHGPLMRDPTSTSRTLISFRPPIPFSIATMSESYFAVCVTPPYLGTNSFARSSHAGS